MEQVVRRYWNGKSRSGKYEKFLKRQAARLMRRLAKRMLEEAPRRHRYRGWSD